MTHHVYFLLPQKPLDFPPSPWMILEALATFDPQDKAPSNSELGRRASLSERTVAGWLEWLHASRIITWTKIQGEAQKIMFIPETLRRWYPSTVPTPSQVVLRRQGHRACPAQVCSTCRRELPETKFSKTKAGGRLAICRTCKAENRPGRNTPKTREQILGTARQLKALLRAIKVRAAYRGYAFDLYEHWDQLLVRLAVGRCEMSGIVLDFNANCRSPYLPTIDRIDSNRGYTYDNVRIICWGMNAAMNHWGEEPLRKIMTSWLKRSP